MNDKIAAPMTAKPDLPALPEAELWVATGLRGLEIHQPNHVVGVSPAEVNEEVESASGPGWGVWTTDPYYTAAQMQAYARAAVEQGAPEGREPARELLVSMAICLDHGFGLRDARSQEATLYNMRKLWDEVMGRGFYSPERKAFYRAAAPAPQGE